MKLWLSPADGIFDHEVHFGVGYEVQFDLGMFESHGPGEGRKGRVIQTVKTLFSEDVSSEVFEDVGEEEDIGL